MPDLTVSTTVDNFMQSADAAAARAAIEAVSGPASAAANNIPVFDGNSGKLLSDSGISYQGGMPVLVKSGVLNVLTAGAPADIGTISIPAWVTRWAMGTAAPGSPSRVLAITAAGTLAAGAITLRDTPAGGGSAFSASVILPASSTNCTPIGQSGAATYQTNVFTVHVNQTTNSANAGTIQIWLWLWPLL